MLWESNKDDWRRRQCGCQPEGLSGIQQHHCYHCHCCGHHWSPCKVGGKGGQGIYLHRRFTLWRVSKVPGIFYLCFLLLGKPIPRTPIISSLKILLLPLTMTLYITAFYLKLHIATSWTSGWFSLLGTCLIFTKENLLIQFNWLYPRTNISREESNIWDIAQTMAIHRDVIIPTNI